VCRPGPSAQTGFPLIGLRGSTDGGRRSGVRLSCHAVLESRSACAELGRELGPARRRRALSGVLGRVDLRAARVDVTLSRPNPGAGWRRGALGRGDRCDLARTCEAALPNLDVGTCVESVVADVEAPCPGTGGKPPAGAPAGLRQGTVAAGRPAAARQSSARTDDPMLGTSARLQPRPNCANPAAEAPAATHPRPTTAGTSRRRTPAGRRTGPLPANRRRARVQEGVNLVTRTSRRTIATAGSRRR